MKDLKGKIAFVTGGSSGIGLGIVKVLAGDGMKVAFTWRRQEHLDEAMAYFKSRPDQTVYPVKLDVTDRDGFRLTADEVERKLGPVQVLVNNAGVGILGMMEDATWSDWDWIIKVNLGGVVNGIMTFLPRMLASKLDCHVVNVSSMGGVCALGSAGLYATTKFALLGLSESLRTDMIGRNVGVSVYCPGPVKSNIGEGSRVRPKEFADTGYHLPPMPKDAPPHPMMIHGMEAVEAGRCVLKGIKENKLFILSHPEFRDVIAARCDALMAAIPNEPINELRAESVRWLLSNRIYSEGA
ncbi:MAG: SDR family NAD(P)-dependent oxidoreductase [Gammaproteobacteria bacterium]|nr:SDR family NAD(P)-dependent oxidoreductase [Gammaproteobacteria bacterium]